MLNLLKSSHFILALGLFVVFWIATRFIDVHIALQITNALMMAAAAAAAVAYAPVVWRSLSHPETKNSIQHLALGIFYAWFFGALWRFWSILWLTSGQDPAMLNNYVVAFLQAGIFLGACYHLTAPGAIRDDLPRAKWIVLGLVVGVGVLAATALVLYKPNTRWLVEIILPYVPR